MINFDFQNFYDRRLKSKIPINAYDNIFVVLRCKPNGDFIQAYCDNSNEILKFMKNITWIIL